MDIRTLETPLRDIGIFLEQLELVPAYVAPGQPQNAS
jgi:hypothetical protein